ncbi:SMI1/KNR4 family protein [Brevibacillus sp. MS2.2]|uniref:SMI1/KNR4 family protein n=1 Tax=Brevibacillus sp. MS2.2 TaxID=2738981 RepID=UPI00156B3FB1|nr:SMI1/KNR4 family protein [Brevibacillus sp. MS2.2]NRR19430.1 SMI1/KNR4 family protein [Brevibacillus sp. MS2.2]
MSNPFDSILDRIRGRRETINGDLHITSEEHEFIFCKSNDSITNIEEQLKTFDLPGDYVSFLGQFDSAVLFQHIEYGGGYDILSPQHVIKYWKSYSIDHPYYPIAWSSHSTGCICVDQDRIHSGNGYLTWVGSIIPDDTIDIDLTFTEWLDKLIEHEGKEFWIPAYEE